MAQTIVCECQSSANVLTWVIVVVGWFIVNRQHNSREKRREIRTLLDQFNESLNQIEVSAIAYHTNHSHEPELARTIKRDIDQVAQKGRRLSLLENQKYNRLSIQLRQAVTLNNFDSPSAFNKQKEDSELIAAIYSAIDKLNSAMEQGFINKYHTK